MQGIGLCSRQELAQRIEKVCHPLASYAVNPNSSLHSQATRALEEVTTSAAKAKLEAKIKRWEKGLLVHACACRKDIWSLVHEVCLQRWTEITHMTKCPQCSQIYAIPEIPEPGEEGEASLAETSWCVLSPGDMAREENHIFDLVLDRTKRGLATQLSKDNHWYGKPRGITGR